MELDTELYPLVEGEYIVIFDKNTRNAKVIGLGRLGSIGTLDLVDRVDEFRNVENKEEQDKVFMIAQKMGLNDPELLMRIEKWVRDGFDWVYEGEQMIDIER